MIPFPPSSPSLALFKDGELVHMIERHHIEGRTAEIISENLIGAYNVAFEKNNFIIKFNFYKMANLLITLFDKYWMNFFNSTILLK